jgi:hypothetical protein
MSLAILKQRHGDRVDRAMGHHHRVVGGQRLELVGRGGERQAGDLGDFSATFSAKPSGEARPVPTAVPPWASSISIGSVISMRLMPFSSCLA